MTLDQDNTQEPAGQERRAPEYIATLVAGEEEESYLVDTDKFGAGFYGYKARVYDHNAQILSMEIGSAKSSRNKTALGYAFLSAMLFICKPAPIEPLSQQEINRQLIPDCAVQAILKTDGYESEATKDEKLLSLKGGFDEIVSRNRMQGCIEDNTAPLLKQHSRLEKTVTGFRWAGNTAVVLSLFAVVSGFRIRNSSIAEAETQVDDFVQRRDEAHKRAQQMRPD